MKAVTTAYEPDLIHAYADLKLEARGWTADMGAAAWREAVEKAEAVERLWQEERRQRRDRPAAGPMDRLARTIKAMEGRAVVEGAVALGADDLAAIGLLPGRKP